MSRESRQHDPQYRRDPKGRTDGQKDYDRILYSSAFRRLANVTQVVAANQSALIHNRLTHTLKVAQLGRRIAQKLLRDYKDNKVLVKKLGGLDVDVVEAACLAHDLGHPPFGHIAEKKLDELAIANHALGGFEGNAQSFRIVTKLATRTADKPGLDLSRATLNALLKYPWERTRTSEISSTGQDKSKKWGAYHSEVAELRWVRQGISIDDERRSLEAEVMDFADDIAYSIYDIEDFYRANQIPMHDLFVRDHKKSDHLSNEADRFFVEVFARLGKEGKIKPDEHPEYRDAFRRMVDIIPRLEPVFSNTHKQRSLLRDWTSTLVNRYIKAVSLEPSDNPHARRTKIEPAEQRELTILKQITWHYVITNNGLATQQHGYRKIIKMLFEALLESARGGGYMLPISVREALDNAKADGAGGGDDLVVRVVIDYIASMTEQEALALYKRIEGISFGSFQSTSV